VDKILADQGVQDAAPASADGADDATFVAGSGSLVGSGVLGSALGPPPKAAIDAAHAQGVRVAALIGRVEEAVRDVNEGVDIIVAQGYEAGGHTGEVATMVLVPDVVDAVAPVPVLAAGGIGDRPARHRGWPPTSTSDGSRG
jgi:NAD(P)H-dependent flavin oxidoreductase YrpB (nitropropane dioxygenase family)